MTITSRHRSPGKLLAARRWSVPSTRAASGQVEGAALSARRRAPPFGKRPSVSLHSCGVGSGGGRRSVGAEKGAAFSETTERFPPLVRRRVRWRAPLCRCGEGRRLFGNDRAFPSTRAASGQVEGAALSVRRRAPPFRKRPSVSLHSCDVGSGGGRRSVGAEKGAAFSETTERFSPLVRRRSGGGRRSVGAADAKRREAPAKVGQRRANYLHPRISSIVSRDTG
jgi:hypothetical protein